MLVTLELDPSRRELRQFGFLAAVILPIIGLSSGRGLPVLAAVGGLSLLFSLLWPQGNRPLFVVMSLAAYPIGLVVSHVALAVLFFAILTPVGLLFRLLGRDPLTRRFEPERSSYWVDAPRTERKKDYFRQF